MKKRTKKSMLPIILFLTIVLICSVVSRGVLPVKAANLSYNDGKRHTVCTTFSKDANDYYTGAYDFESLKTLSGSSSKSSLDTMDSNLYNSLHNLMSSTQTVNPTYSGYTSNSLATYWEYTDASEGEEGYYFFYTDEKRTVYSSAEMNREHVWAKSRASFYQKNGGSDLHHLRPSIKSINSSRSNYTFGYIKGVLDTYSTASYDGKDVLWFSKTADLVEVPDKIKGDVARILLYVYVRWQQPNLFEDLEEQYLPELEADDDQNTGYAVIESLDTLLEWMEIDPVDTWEMSRNDITQDVQGNRNVFIDYPEFAWMLFDEKIPNDMQTPSGYAKAYGDSTLDCDHDFDLDGVDAVCDSDGYYIYSCDLCGYSYTERIQATGHDWECIDSQYHIYECTVCKIRKIITLAKLVDTVEDGDLVVIYCDEVKKALGNTPVNLKTLQALSTGKASSDEIYVPDNSALLTVKENDDGTYCFIYKGQYLTCPPTGNGLSLSNTKTDYSLWELDHETGGKYLIKSKNAVYNGAEQYLECYNNFTTYDMQKDPSLFLLSFYEIEDINCKNNAHHYYYETNYDGTHDTYCYICNYHKKANCSYENGKCIYCLHLESETIDTDINTDTEKPHDSDVTTDSDEQTDTEKESDTDSEINTDTTSDEVTDLIGDVDGNNDINMLDVVTLQKAIAKLIGFTPDQVVLADVNFDGKNTMEDVVLIQKYIAKLITSFKRP